MQSVIMDQLDWNEGRERTISGEEALQMSTMSLGQKAHYKKESTVVPETAKLFSGSIISQNAKSR